MTDPFGGCEPYSMDFGDREIRAWLEKNLTRAELAEHDELIDRAWRADGTQPWRFRGRLRRRLVWPYTWVLRRRLRRFTALATERGGPMPGPSWKIRHVWGVAGGER